MMIASVWPGCRKHTAIPNLSSSIRKFNHNFTHSVLNAEWAIRLNWSSYIRYCICESEHSVI